MLCLPTRSACGRTQRLAVIGMRRAKERRMALVLLMSGLRWTCIRAIVNVVLGDFFYKQFPVLEGAGNRGLNGLGIKNLPPLVTRGILINVPFYRGIDLCEGELISPDDLQGTLNQQHVSLQPGDIVLIRTGWSRYYENDNPRYVGPAPGIGLAAAEWLTGHHVVMVGSDTMVLEVVPDEIPTAPYPVHQHLLVKSGVYILENAKLDEIAEARVYEFLCLCLVPKFKGATASPVRLTALV